MYIALASGKIASIKKWRQDYVTHLLFADDTLVFLKANKKSLKGLSVLLEQLQMNTGLKINKEKRKIFF